MNIRKSLDVEDEIRKALKSYFTIYCRPLPENFTTPSLLVTAVGGDEIENRIDLYDIVLDSRATDDGEAMDLLLEATAVLRTIAETQTTPIRYIVKNSIAAWGSDPVRPDLALCSSRMTIYMHKETKELNKTLTVKCSVSGDRTINDLSENYNISGYDGITLKISDAESRTVTGTSGLIHTIKKNIVGNVCTWTIDNVKAATTITFTEANYEIEDYSHTGETTKIIIISDINLVEFSNSYEAATAPLTINCSVSGDRALSDMPNNFEISGFDGLVFTLDDAASSTQTGTSGRIYTISKNIVGNVCSWILDKVVLNTVVEVSESNYEIDDYTHSGTTTQSTTITENENLIEFSNSYEAASYEVTLDIRQSVLKSSGALPAGWNQMYLNVLANDVEIAHLGNNNYYPSDPLFINAMSGAGRQGNPLRWNLTVRSNQTIKFILEHIPGGVSAKNSCNYGFGTSLLSAKTACPELLTTGLIFEPFTENKSIYLLTDST